jgi:16S rRNA (uracil1498-N3)-methyltransferase
MHRFFVSSRIICGQKAVIVDVKQAHHMRDVLRLKLSEQVVLCDEYGNEYRGIIEKITADDVHVAIQERRAPEKTKSFKLCIACAIPKNVKMDDIVDTLTQLGVDTIIPLMTERVIVRLNPKKAEERVLRWRKIAEKAAQQSQRSQITRIESIRDLKGAIKEAQSFDLKLIPTLEGKRESLSQAIGAEKCRSIFVCIGPEGDFTAREVRMAIAEGFIPVTLGDLVLRVDTAAIAVASYIR